MTDTTEQNSEVTTAVRDCHRLLEWIIPQLDKMPRLRRYTLGERLETLSVSYTHLTLPTKA